MDEPTVVDAEVVEPVAETPVEPVEPVAETPEPVEVPVEPTV